MRIGDYGVKLYFSLEDENGDPLQFQEGDAVMLEFVAPSGARRTVDMVISDPVGGEAYYVLQPGDITEKGEYTLMVILKSDLKRITSQYLKLKVRE